MQAVIDRRWLVIGIGVVTLIAGWVVWDAWTSDPVGRWFDRAGNPIPDERLHVWTGSRSCDISGTTFMALTWPLDPAATYEPEIRMESYVWQPPHGYLASDAVTPGIVEAMPSDAKNTGFHRRQLTLWISESNLRKAVYVTDGDEIQRWAFSPGAGICV